MLQTKNLEFSYDGQNWLKFPDIHCKEGEHWLLMGLSGSGKTTLLHLLGGLRTPKKGDIIIADTNISKLSTSKLDHFRGKQIGIVFQKAYFVRSLTVEENLKLAQKLAGQPISDDRIKELLERLNVAHKLKEKTDSLSIGEQH
jgi:putative ABC transport system ATP-binding protein